MGRSRESLSKERAIYQAKWLFCGDRVRIGVASDAQGSIDFLRGARRAPSAGGSIRGKKCAAHARTSCGSYCRLLLLHLSVHLQQASRDTVRLPLRLRLRRTHATGKRKDCPKLSGCITPRFRPGTLRRGKTGGGSLRQGRRVGPRVGLANEAPTSEDSSIDSERGRGMAR